MMFWRWMKRTLYSLLALVIIFLTAVTLLLTTHTGGKLSLYVAEKSLPGTLEYDSWQGAILRDFEITELRYRDGDINIEIDYLQLRWRPWQLLKRQLHAREIEINGARMQMPESQAPVESNEPLFPIDLPDIQLPISIRLDQVLLTDISFQQGAQKQYIERVQMRGRTRGDTIHLHSFSLTTPDFHTQLHGTFTPVGNYPLNLNTLVRFELPEYGFTTAVGSLSGNTEAVQLTQQISGFVSAEIDVEVTQPLTEDLAWNGLIRVLQSTSDGLIPDIDWLNASIQGSGTLSTVAGEFRVEGKHKDHGIFVANSEAAFANETFSLDSLFVRAEKLGLMLDWTGEATIIPAENMDDTDIQMSMGGLLRFQDYVNADITLDLHGTPTELHDFSLQAQSNESSLTLTGSLSWVDEIQWDVAFDINNLVLDRFNPQWPGLINIALTSSGSWAAESAADNTDITVNLASLEGELQGEPIAVSGNLRWVGEDVTIQQLLAEWGEQQLAGDIHANLANTTATLDIQGEKLVYDNYSIAEISANVIADWSLKNLPTGTVKVSNVAQNEQPLINNLNLDLTQQTNTHSIALQGNAFETDVALEFTGEWQAMQWQGQIEAFNFASEQFENWRLENTAQATFSQTLIEVDQFCINNETRNAGFCLEADWSLATQKGNIEARVDSLQLSLMQPIIQQFMEDELDITGSVNANIMVLIEENELEIDSVVNISDSTIGLPQQDLEFRVSASELLRVQGNQDQLTAYLDLRARDLEGGVKGELVINDALNFGDVAGNVNVQLENLAIVSVLVPQLQAVEGRINGELGIGGRLSGPIITGYLEVLEAGGEVPAAGIRVTNLNVRLDAPGEVGEPFSLSAQARSGQGSINIDGRYFFTEQQADVQIRGENFQAMQTRELQVSISPNLDLSYSAEGLRARGELTVPSALITPPDIETIDSSSRDTVIVRGEETVFSFEEESLPIDADIQVILGNNVRVEAFGFDGRLEGRLRVREQPGQPTSAVGTINVATGRYEIFGQPLDIDRGNFTFTGGAIDNPGLDLRVSRSVESENVSVGARIGGSLREPNLTFFSTPAMQDSAILSYLILGRAPGADSGEANVFAQATLALGMQGGNFIGEQLGQALGVDEVMLDSTGDNLENTSLFIGKHLSSRLYVKYGIGLIEPVNTFFIRYRLTDHLHFETQTSGEHSGADIFYSIER